ncbi:MAG: cytochrome c [Desulfuromonadia bacterium]
MKTSIRIMVTTLSAAALMTLSSTVSFAESCFLAKQLENPEARVLYEQTIREAQESEKSVFGGRVDYSTEFIFATGERQTVDSFSSDCMSCHDGMNAPYHDVRIRNGARRGGLSLETVLASHPIGMHYGSAAYENRSLRGVDELDPNIILADGRVGCLSCHNMLNPDKFHLVVDNGQSGLCFQCHN